MSKSCLVWFANGTDISNTSHSILTTGSFWSSAGASKCFSPESAECISISPLLSFAGASCCLKGKKKSQEEDEGKTVGVQDLTCLEFQWFFLVWQGSPHLQMARDFVFGGMGLEAVLSLPKVELHSQSKGHISEDFPKCWNKLNYCREAEHSAFPAAPQRAGGGGEGGGSVICGED